MDCSLPHSSVHGISQAIILGWLAIFLKGSSQPKDQTISCIATWVLCHWATSEAPCPSVAESCPTRCDPMDCSTPGFPVHRWLPEFTQTHVLWVGDAIQQSHHLSPFLLPPSIFPSISVFSMNQFFSSGGQSIGVSASASVLPMNTQDWFSLALTGLILQSKGLSRVFSNTTVQKICLYTR